MTNILFTSFNGKTNSSMIFAEAISKATNTKNIIIKNSYKQSVNQLHNALLTENPNYLISFGQRPKTNTVFIETKAHCTKILNNLIPSTKENFYNTNFHYKDIYTALKSHDINVALSKNAGNYFCNHLYYSGLYYINTLNLKTKYIFIHTPSIKNFSDYDKLLAFFIQWVDSINSL